MNPKVKRFAAATLLLAALGAGGYFAVQMTIAQVRSDSQINPLLTGDRTRLSVCVDGAGGLSISDEDMHAVQEALEDGLATLSEIPAEYREREVTAGCPLPSELLGTADGSFGLYGPHFWPGDDGTPNEHRLFFYFTPDQLYEATFGDEPYAYGPAEFACGGHECVEVTAAVYAPVTAPEEALRESLLRGLGLVPGPPNPEPILDWAACERGEQPHPDHSCDQYEEWKRDQEK